MDAIQSIFLKEGLLGATIVVLFLIMVWLQKRIDAKDLSIQDLNNRLGALADLRLKDSKDNNLVNNNLIEKYATLAEKGVTNDGLMMQAINGIATELRNK